MAQDRPGFTPDKRAENDNRKPRNIEPTTKIAPAQPKQESFQQRWDAIQPSKTAVFWYCLASIALTMIVGFTWGGWVRGSTAQQTAENSARDAVVSRLATICVAQYHLDPAKGQKLVDLQATASYQRGTYVTEQGWATMPGEEEPDRRVADACASQLIQLEQ
jgi:hypothetical protein